jgi:hypothetical protein
MMSPAWQDPREILAQSKWSNSAFTESSTSELPQYPAHTQLIRIAQWFEQETLSSEELNSLLARWWTTGGYAADIGNKLAIEMFRFAGFVGQTELTRPPTQAIELYRGAPIGRELGLSWSFDRDVAAWFSRLAISMGMEGILCATSVGPHQVLGVFDGSTENEAAIDTCMLDHSKIRTISGHTIEVEILANERMIKRCDQDYGDDLEGRDERIRFLLEENDRLKSLL